MGHGIWVELWGLPNIGWPLTRHSLPLAAGLDAAVRMLQAEAANALLAEDGEDAAAAAVEAEHVQQGSGTAAGAALAAPVAQQANGAASRPEEQPQRGEKALQADDPTLLELLKQHRCLGGEELQILVAGSHADMVLLQP